MTNLFSEVESLIKKAETGVNPLHALQFSQAAVNAANALRVHADMREIESK